MATRRMFSRDITDSDAFADMPLSTQALYFHLCMCADDDGFVNNAKKIQRSIGASADDLTLLAAKGFIIAFDSGIIAVKHWRINNYIRSDRKVDTKYADEMTQLIIKENGAYSLAEQHTKLLEKKNGIENYGPEQDVCNSVGTCLPDDGQVTVKCPNSIGKDRIGEDSKNILSGKPDDASDSAKAYSEEAAEIVAHLNQRTGSSFRASSKATARHISARLREGFTVDDFKAVIDCKAREWGCGEMAKYLRPETLFGSKFEGYLMQARKGGVVNADWRKYD